MRWELKTCDNDRARQLAAEVGVLPVVARLLLQRGVHTPEQAVAFLKPSLAHLHSPYLMSGMREAVERLCAAIERRERVLIYGDYDVDGTTAIVVLKTAIEMCGGTAEFHVPHRIREGYGMRDEVIERAAAEGVRLVISVDTGIRAFAAAEMAHHVGVDLIVTDHHLPEANGGALPSALAVLNPNKAGCEYPCKVLCGAAVAFKLAQALLERLRANGSREAFERLLVSFLKIVAIATVADAVPLTGENRAIASIGLAALRDPRGVGLRALVESAGIDLSRTPTAGDIAFRVAPRLNAAGRMDIARDVVDLLAARDAAQANQLAAKLNQLNSDRQQEEQKIMSAIAEQTPDASDRYSLVIAGDGWHRGVIGIAATRVVERYNRPALVISRDDAGEAHGSGRSIRNFHLLEALESCADLFTRFGGHAHAVGFSLPCDRVPQLANQLEQFARTRLTSADLEPLLDIHADLDFCDITPRLYEELCQLEPFGMANPQPRFVIRKARVLGPPKPIKEKHLRFKLGATSNGSKFVRSWDAMGWRMAAEHSAIAPGDTLDVAFTIDANTHPEFGGIELGIADLRRADMAMYAAATNEVSGELRTVNRE